MTQYTGRVGRPFEFVTVPAAGFPITLPDETGGLLLEVSDFVAFAMKDGTSASATFQAGFVPGDFATITFASVELFAVLISR